MRGACPGITSAQNCGGMTVAEFRRVLVTGGAGFIGSNYVRYAADVHPEWELVVLDALTYAANADNLASVRGRVTFVHGDIANATDVHQAVAGVDAIVNFAAESHVDRSLRDAAPFLHTNVVGVVTLLEHARRGGVARFLQVSTDEVYGDLTGTTAQSREDDPFRPRSPYAASKAAAEHFVLSYGVSYGLDVVCTRGSNTYGPYQYPEKIIPLFITNALDDRPLPVYGDGSAVRDYMHVSDHVAGIDAVLHRGQSGAAYNLAAGQHATGLTVARTVLDVLGKSHSLIQLVPDRPGHDYRYSVQTAKAAALPWQAQVGLREGIAETTQWYRRHEVWWRGSKLGAAFREHEQAWYGPRE
jgi:dTDP-glucose 4,6-dehydratase